jgi:hypothetical protein
MACRMVPVEITNTAALTPFIRARLESERSESLLVIVSSSVLP